MTATHVNGVAVIIDEPAPSPISRPGADVTFDQIRHLLLADGAETYGCLHCPYVSENISSVRGHLKAHSSKPKGQVRKASKPATPTVKAAPTNPAKATPRRNPAQAARDLASLSLGELVERAQLTEQMRAQRDAAREQAAQAYRSVDDWKQRADDYRLRLEGMKSRAEASDKKLAQIRALVK
ncbi:hypothetical protein ABZ851_29980 [Streptomyces sp. NPDC047049]|uniref:hypothetical protein n=1 Tax=Streptomyces sp. NPDC047049 TaxID=3156688 RepID=UPI0033D0BE9C